MPDGLRSASGVGLMPLVYQERVGQVAGGAGRVSIVSMKILFDLVVSSILLLVALPLRFAARHRPILPTLQWVSDRIGIQVRSTHYYEPTYAERDLPENTERPRSLPGIKFNE